MLRFVAIVLALAGLGLIGAGWTLYDDYRGLNSGLAWYDAHPEEVPAARREGETRAQFLQSQRARITPMRGRAQLAGAGGLVLLVAGIGLFLRARPAPAAAEPWPAGDEAGFARWRDQHLGNPVAVRPRSSVHVLRHLVVGLFVLMAIAVVAARPALASAGLAALLLGLAGVLFALFRNAGRRAATAFDHEGLSRGDGRRLPWRDLQGLEYQLALSRRHVHEALWRITLHFRGDEAWVVPAQTANLDEILALLAAMPVPRRKRDV